MRSCKCGCGEALPASALQRRLFLNATHRNRYEEARRGHDDRPTEIACVRCGRNRQVAPMGKVPRFCGSVCAQEYTKETRKAATAKRRASWRCEFCGLPSPRKGRANTKKYCAKCVGRASRLYNRGITLEAWLAMARAQGWRCAICECGGDRQSAIDLLCIDHCPDTGAVRGLLCRTCNTGIGHLRDDTELVRRALAYLENANRPRLRLIA